MDTNHNTAIKMSTDVIITLYIVGIIVTLTLILQPTLDKVIKKTHTVSEQMDTLSYKTYDNSPASGSEVLSAINTKASKDFKIFVTTKAGGTVVYTGYSYNITDINDTNYIEPTGEFMANLTKTTNKTISGITFIQR